VSKTEPPCNIFYHRGLKIDLISIYLLDIGSNWAYDHLYFSIAPQLDAKQKVVEEHNLNG